VKIAHVGIAVTSLEDATKTYTDGLGLTVATYQDVPDDGARVAMIPMGDSRIELIESTRADSPIDRFIRRRGPGLHHVALEVDDIEATLERLKTKGARLIDEVPRSGAGGTRIAFLHPSSAGGVLLELIEHGE
jgi:methylmalonyl-CoA/ethylmalonyl-CoA epimerase